MPEKKILTNEELATIYNDFETAAKLRMEDMKLDDLKYLTKLQIEIVNRFLNEYLHLEETE